MDNSFGPQRAHLFNFQPTTAQNTPAPSASTNTRVEPIAEPEWTLSATQVALIVLAIIAACELIGSLF